MVEMWIVVPTFERFKCISHLISQLQNQSFKNYKLIVIDHGSKKIKISNTTKLEYLTADSSLWWTGAVNVGIQYVLSKIEDISAPILVINDDVEISNNNYLKNLYCYWLVNKNHIVGSICTTPSKRIIYANMLYNYKRGKLQYKFQDKHLSELKTDILHSHVLKGRGTLIPSNVFLEIGLFNQRFLPHYKADHEFAYRAYRKGYELVVLKNAVLFSELNSPNEFDSKKKFSSVWKILTGVRSVNNIKDLFYYSYLCFTPFYACYYFLINTLRILFVNFKRLISL